MFEGYRATQKENSMNASLEGVSLHVKDVKSSIEFYSRIPGAELVFERPGQFARFKIGDGYLHVVQIQANKGFHIEMTTDNLNDMYDSLTAAGIEPESRPVTRPWGKTDFRVLDPDGNILEFDARD